MEPCGRADLIQEGMIGLYKAIMGYRPGKDLYLVGADGLEETVRHIKEGTVTGTVLTDYRLQSHTAADMALAMAAGDPVEREYRTEGIKIAAE